jgi:hypothetical protein
MILMLLLVSLMMIFVWMNMIIFSYYNNLNLNLSQNLINVSQPSETWLFFLIMSKDYIQGMDKYHIFVKKLI